eukprot:5188693-Amphidinium_carterae.2
MDLTHHNRNLKATTKQLECTYDLLCLQAPLVLPLQHELRALCAWSCQRLPSEAANRDYKDHGVPLSHKSSGLAGTPAEAAATTTLLHAKPAPSAEMDGLFVVELAPRS